MKGKVNHNNRYAHLPEIDSIYKLKVFDYTTEFTHSRILNLKVFKLKRTCDKSNEIKVDSYNWYTIGIWWIYKRYAIAVSYHENQNLQQGRDSPMSMA